MDDHSSQDGYTSLDSINESNVGPLSVAWAYGAEAAFTAAPVAGDGVVYADVDGSEVHAISADTGRPLWRFDAKVPSSAHQQEERNAGQRNRGVEYWQGKVYFTARDGRLFALDAATGAPVWERKMSIGSAPYIADGRIVLAIDGTRDTSGHLAAFDAATGKPLWTLTESAGPSDATAERVATRWGAMAYDPDLRLLYVSETAEHASIRAVRPETGRTQWQYRLAKTEPQSDAASASLMLAELEIDDARRRVVMQARSNGQLHVVDRTDGKEISSSSYDESGGARFEHPPVYSPKVKLLYLPIEANGMQYLQAWNPATAKEQWRIVLEDSTPCGGLLTTAGNLLLQGDSQGYLNVYESEWGEVRERVAIDACPTQAPFSYSAHGIQYIGVLASGKILALRLGGGETKESRTMKRYPRTIRPEETSS